MISQSSDTTAKNVSIFLSPVSHGTCVYSFGQNVTHSAAGRLFPKANLAVERSVFQVSVDIEENAPQQSIEQTFHRFAQKWRDETRGLSSPTRKLLNLNYLEILRLPPSKVVPLILRELEERPGDWFLALKLLTRENPVAPEDADNFRKVRETWLEWGKKKLLL